MALLTQIKKALLEDLDIQDWYNSLSLRSKGTAKTYLRILKIMGADGLNIITQTERDIVFIRR